MDETKAMVEKYSAIHTEAKNTIDHVINHRDYTGLYHCDKLV